MFKQENVLQLTSGDLKEEEKQTNDYRLSWLPFNIIKTLK
jgi:hypothetical protein